MQSVQAEINHSTDFVFVHGGGQGGWVWQQTIDALHQQSDGKFGRALALDAPGCGAKRGRDTAHLDSDAVIDEFLADIEAKQMRDIVLVGHSQAGTILPRLVERRPDLFRRLVYVSCIAPAPGQNIMQQMGSSLQGSNENEVGWPFDPRALEPRERYARMFCNDMNTAAADNFLAKLGTDTWPMQTMTASDWRCDHLSDIPSTYVICLQDQVLPVVWQERFAARLNVQNKAFIDAGHQAMNTRPQALAEILLHAARPRA